MIRLLHVLMPPNPSMAAARTATVVPAGTETLVRYAQRLGCSGQSMALPLSIRFPFSSWRVTKRFTIPKSSDSQAAKELVEQRDRWLNAEGLSDAEKKKRTLTNLYNQRPTWLDLAHKRLDEAVFAAYGWTSDLSDEEILERLLALNLERSKAEVV